MRLFGIILIILGFAGTFYYGFEAIQESETFNFLGIQIAISNATWLPVIISVSILIIGVVLYSKRRIRKK